jgi:pimeloyl-ACP methyl ester carboxylesterase
VVLAGHAYAGAVIGATRHPSVKALVYVAALAPAEGETVADVFYRNEPHPLAPKLAPDAQGLIWFPEEAFPVAFAPNATAQENTILAAAQRPPSLPCLTTPAPRPRWLDVPTWYLLAKQDRMILERTQRFMAERMRAHLVEHDVDHTPSVTAPQAVVDLILRAVRAAA